MDFRRLKPGDAETAQALFASIAEDAHFQPHAMTPEMAREICGHEGQDGYYGAFERDTMVAYGMLRGWDDGFEHPSLGIAVHPVFRGLGYATKMMAFLHQEARAKGATKIRLRVHPDNRIARAMYERMGYDFDGEVDRDQLVAWYGLPR